MTQDERRLWLIQALLAERPDGGMVEVPEDPEGQRLLLRALLNIRPPEPASEEFLRVQDAYLRQRAIEKGVTTEAEIGFGPGGIAVWRGDITTLAVDGIVNAANSQMLGCFSPNHGCIDNAIHTFAGVQLRLECARLMDEQGHEEPTGRAKVTPAYNLPSRFVLHTVGPIVRSGHPGPRERLLLGSCYRSCLELAAERGLGSVAFCCISTGVFGYPNRAAAKVAVRAVREFKERTGSEMRVVFNVFKPEDLRIYQGLLA